MAVMLADDDVRWRTFSGEACRLAASPTKAPTKRRFRADPKRPPAAP